MTSALFLTWQDPETRNWYPVGRLTMENGDYVFVYTTGAQASAGFIPFGSMNQLGVKYVSKILFPLFANRLLTKSRPEYDRFLSWMGFYQREANSLELLARTGASSACTGQSCLPAP